MGEDLCMAYCTLNWPDINRKIIDESLPPGSNIKESIASNTNPNTRLVPCWLPQQCPHRQQYH